MCSRERPCMHLFKTCKTVALLVRNVHIHSLLKCVCPIYIINARGLLCTRNHHFQRPIDVHMLVSWRQTTSSVKMELREVVWHRKTIHMRVPIRAHGLSKSAVHAACDKLVYFIHIHMYTVHIIYNRLILQ